jgi:thiol:disulfide interchange protein
LLSRIPEKQMKKITIFLIVILVVGINVFAQTSKVRKKANAKASPAKTVNAKTKTVALEREKFDPARNPVEDLKAAIARAQKESKRIVLDIGGEWCGWCVKMDYYFLENKALAKFRDQNFIWIKVNLSPENENREFLAKYPPAAGYPHLYVLESDGSLLHSQNTADLEEVNLPVMNVQSKDELDKKAKERSYDIVKFVEFLKRWASQ